MKHLWLLIVIPFAFALSGCVFGTTGPIDVNGLADAATDRIGAHVQIRQAETKVAVAVVSAIQKDTELEIAKLQAKPAVIVEIKDAQSMALYQLGEANKRLARSNEIMGEVALSLSTGNRKYDSLVQFTPFPKGAFSEGFDSFFGGIAGVAQTGAAQILSGGLATKMVVEQVNKGNQGTVFHGDVRAENAFNTSTQQINGSSGSTGTLAPSIVRPEVVVVEPGVEMPSE